ncbi:Uncharacterised protein [Mycobacterium tuberculosis]|nr:Uncharacterised protein [Mycobacterium tuberculosis]
MQSRSGRPLLTGQAFGGFQYRASAGVAAVIGDDVGGERVDRDNLGDDVEVAARVQLHLDMRERLQARAEFAAGASNTFGHRADQPVIAGQQGDDPVGFAELVLAQHNSPVPIQPHHNSFAPRHDIAGIRADSLVPRGWRFWVGCWSHFRLWQPAPAHPDRPALPAGHPRSDVRRVGATFPARDRCEPAHIERLPGSAHRIRAGRRGGRR